MGTSAIASPPFGNQARCFPYQHWQRAWKNFKCKRIGSSQRIVVAAPKLVADGAPPAAPADLARVPMLHQQEQAGRSALTLVNDAGARETVQFEPRLASGDFELLVAAACAGIGAVLLPRSSCRAELVSGRLVRLLPGWGAPDGIVHLVFTSRRGMLPGVRAALDFAAEALRSAID